MGSRSQEVAFQTFTNTSAVAESKLAGMTGTITALQQQVTQVKTSVDRKVADLTNTVTAVDARSSSILSQGTQLRAEVDGMKGKVEGLVRINPEEIRTKLGLVSGLATRMESLETVVKR
jgi:predicted lipoprotein